MKQNGYDLLNMTLFISKVVWRSDHRSMNALMERFLTLNFLHFELYSVTFAFTCRSLHHEKPSEGCKPLRLQLPKVGKWKL